MVLARLVAAIVALAGAQEAPVQGAFEEMTVEQARAIQKGLDYLARTQTKNGSWGNGAAPVATTAIAGLAFLAGGHLPERSRYGEHVRRAVQYLLSKRGRSGRGRGYVNEGQSRGAGGSGMHGHGYAILFLAEVYGMTGSMPEVDTETLKEAVTDGIHVIEAAQCANGGWNYEPNPNFDEGSVTVTQVQALRAARNAGIKVNPQTIEKAVEYINKSTDAAGQTRYSLTSGGHSSFALTAAGMSVLNFLGQYNNDKIKKGCDSLLRQLPGQGANNANMGAWGGWYFYGNYYATLALYQMGNESWRKWFVAVRADLLKTQSPDGAWKNAESGQYGESFGTGFALQILQIPCRYLPIYQRAND
ncbi:MAG: terpene cyclase/mutase family protein [Planctomycetes bacterium]|nr:terpene cyclase/mutase family protein [Planctomycetota bacterium]